MLQPIKESTQTAGYTERGVSNHTAYSRYPLKETVFLSIWSNAL